MLARRAVQLVFTQRKFVAQVPKVTVARFMGSNAAPTHAAPAHTHSHAGHENTPQGDVVIPELVDTLEWVLDSPPNVHQFDEPPIIVEVEHLKTLKGPEHH